MNHIVKNIKKIRVLKNYSQQAMAEMLGITRATLSSYEEGRAEPKLTVVTEIAQKFNLSVDMLLYNDLSINNLTGFKKLVEQPLSINKLVEIAYCEGGNLKEQKVIMPKIANNLYRAFEVYNNAMNQRGKGLLPGDVLIAKTCSLSKKDVWNLAATYVVINDKNYFIGQIDLMETGISLSFKNLGYSPIIFLEDEIESIWQVEKVLQEYT